MNLSFLGLGLMGRPMAARLEAAGWAPTVWSRDAAKCGGFQSVAASAQAAVAQADAVISILSDGAASRSLIVDAGVGAAMKPGAVWIDMASTRPDEARAHAAWLAERGVHHIDAPVSGGTLAAESGTLAIMAGGEEAVFAGVEPVLRALGRPVRVGPVGSGQLAKLANQLVVGITIGAVAEAQLLIEAGGGDPAKFREAIAGGWADSKVMQIHGARMSARDFTKRAAVATQLKDLRNVQAQAGDLALPLSSLVREMLEAQVAAGEAELDHSALLLETARRASA